MNNRAFLMVIPETQIIWDGHGKAEPHDPSLFTSNSAR
jgi:hypothetical protein